MDNNCTQIARDDVEYEIDITKPIENHKLLECLKQNIDNDSYSEWIHVFKELKKSFFLVPIDCRGETNDNVNEIDFEKVKMYYSINEDNEKSFLIFTDWDSIPSSVWEECMSCDNPCCIVLPYHEIQQLALKYSFDYICINIFNSDYKKYVIPIIRQVQ